MESGHGQGKSSAAPVGASPGSNPNLFRFCESRQVVQLLGVSVSAFVDGVPWVAGRSQQWSGVSVVPGPGGVGLSLSQTPFSSFCWLRVTQVGTEGLRKILDTRNML